MQCARSLVVVGAVALLNVFANGQQDAEARANFEPLMQAVSVVGNCSVKTPKGAAPEAVIINRAYPLGSVYFVDKDAALTLNFNADASVKASEGAEFAVDAPANKPDCRVVRVFKGKINTMLPEDFKKDDALVIEAAGFTCHRLLGKAEVQLVEDTATDSLFQVRGVTGRTQVDGLHYTIPQIRAANILQILQAKDQSFTRLTSLSGDYVCELVNGDTSPTLFTLSPKAFVKIFRKRAPLSERLTVTTLTVSPSGKAKNNFSFVVGNEQVRTGELIPVPEEKAQETATPAVGEK